MKKITGILILLLFTVSLSAQNYFKYFKTGKSFYDNKEYKAAIEEFNKVIEEKTDHYNAYFYRGLCFKALNDLDKAASDLKKATALEPKEEEYFFELGLVLKDLKKYNEAIEAFDRVTELDKKNETAYHEKIKTLFEMKEFLKASQEAEKAVNIKKSAENYYLQGVALDSLMNYPEAKYAYSRAVFYNPKMIEAQLGLAHARMGAGEFEKALEACKKAIELDPKNPRAYLVRANIYIKNKDLPKAIDDLSNILSLEPNNVAIYKKRGALYQQISQHQNAILDFSKVLSLEKDDYLTLYNRAKSYEALMNYKKAIADYEAIRKLSPENEKAENLQKEAKKRLYELNRESNNPKIEMIDPKSPKEGIVEIASNANEYIIKGRIIDESPIQYIKVNGKDADFSKDSINPEFKVNLIIKDLEEITITAFDIYQNSETFVFKIVHTEIDPPVVKLIAPYASDDGTVYLDSEDPSLYIEGKIQDESLIKSILIEGTTASFSLEENNPSFSATINIMNKDQFTVIAEDQYGNKTEKVFKLNRDGAKLLAENPMGKTWVVFIENSDYQSFSSLEGPGKDVTMMKSAFAKYQIHNIIHKKNMTKSQLEHFFSIELRDLVRANNVNSILVWYAGHGKYLNETGYWIPVDAKRDDEFTYFNINNLKAAMQSYSKYITHTLVVTDACESGPSFYQAMRADAKEKSCSDWKATRFKSSQVFSSAGYELASDNSQFTKTFATTLSGNPDACIPIETVVNKVTTAVGKSQKQKPKFGKIAGLEDENGTFFFIKK
ncbi:MAG: hypothetical protein Kow0079_06650 [Vicingaceae bacterium]